MFPDNINWFDSPSSCGSLEAIDNLLDEKTITSILSDIDVTAESNTSQNSTKPTQDSTNFTHNSIKNNSPTPAVDEDMRQYPNNLISNDTCELNKQEYQKNSVYGRLLKLEETLASFDNRVKKQASEINLLNLKTSHFKGEIEGNSFLILFDFHKD